MKTTKFLKTLILSVLVAAVLAAAFTLTGCGEELPMSEEITKAVDNVTEFLDKAKTAKNYTDITEYSDGSTYKYYADGDNVKIEENGVITYYLQEYELYYKIYLDEDGTWRKTAEYSASFKPEVRLSNDIKNISGTAWSDYNKKTKTLIFEATNGTVTIKLASNEYICTYTNKGQSLKQTISNIGNTTVTLPEVE